MYFYIAKLSYFQLNFRFNSVNMQKRFSVKQFFKLETTKCEQQKQKMKMKTKAKIYIEDDVIDDRMEIVVSSLNYDPKTAIIQKVEIQKQEATLTTKTEVQEQKQKDLSQNSGNNKKVQQKHANKQALSETKPHSKNIGKSRAKIFKQQRINQIPLKIRTSTHRWTYGEGTTPLKLIIGNWNVNGIRSIISKKMLYPYVNNNKPDIICISQTKADEKNFDTPPHISIPGYHSYWNFPKHSSGYSGVAVFSKYPPKSATEDIQEREHSQEGRILTLEFQSFILINIYVPTVGKQLQRSDYRKKFDTAFRQNVSRIRQKNPKKPVIIIGDLNVAHSQLDTHHGKDIMLTPSFTTIQRQGFQEILNMGYTDVYRALHPGVRAYTWWYVNIGGRDRLDTPGLGRRIDYFLMPNQYMKWVKRCDILRQYYGADHCPVEMQIDMEL